MSQLMEYTRYLTREIGPRPAGTEEEQQAALYITEQFQRETWFSSNIEDFQRRTNPVLSSAVLAGLAVVVTIIAMFVPALSIPAFVLVAAAAAVYVIELLGTPLLSRTLARGASQNVVAKYQPNPETAGTSRAVTRKIILVAHYDTPQVTPAILKPFENIPVSLDVLAAGAAAIDAFLMLLRIFIAISGGGVLVILNTLSILCLIVCLLPIVRFFLSERPSYAPGANNNASGTAALLEIANRISRGCVSEADLARDNEAQVAGVSVHGEEAAYEAGVVPEGATLEYEAAVNVAGSEGLAPEFAEGGQDALALGLETNTESALEAASAAQPVRNGAASLAGAGAAAAETKVTRQEGLLAAKAAIAAMTGQPVDDYIYADIPSESDMLDAEGSDGAIEGELGDYAVDPHAAGDITQIPDDEFALAFNGLSPAAGAAGAGAAGAIEAGALGAGVSAQETGQDVGSFRNVPSWFAAAQQNAKKPPIDAGEIHRSRFTEAIEHAEQERAEKQEALAKAQAEAQAEARRALEEEARASLAAKERERASQASGAGTGVLSAPEQGETLDAELQSAGVNSSSDPHSTELSMNAQAAEGKLAGQAAGTLSDTALVGDHADMPSAEASAPGASSSLASKIPSISADPFASLTTSDVSRSSDNSKANSNEATTQNKAARVDRLRSLRTSVPSLSGVIRTKDSARKSAAEHLPNVVNVPSSMDDKDSASAVHAAVANTMPSSVPSASAASAAENSSVSEFNPQLETDFAAHLVPDHYPSPADRENDEAIDTPARGRVSKSAAETASGASALADSGSASSANKVSHADSTIIDEFETDYTPRAIDDKEFSPTPRKTAGFFDRFRHKKQEETMNSPQEWLGVDENFEARSVGRARGGWESFRNDDTQNATNPFADDSYDTFDDFGTDDRPRRRGRNWEGGAFSRMQLGHVDMRSGEDAEADAPLESLPQESPDELDISQEIQDIYHFRNPAYTTELWFVAMGCDDESHDGVQAFIESHRAELRGSTLIELESLAKGKLSVASHEGAVKKISASSRIKRFTRDAVRITGLKLAELDMSGTESIASLVQKAGYQSMHIFGAENGRPSLKGSAEDKIENIDEQLFEDNVDFVCELLKH